MNANELADMLEVDSWYKLVTREEIATMLRQQQAEIEALKADTIPYKDLHQMVKNVLTHPVKELKLTKSEIEVLWEKHCPFDLTGGLAFARAILKKAQEK